MITDYDACLKCGICDLHCPVLRAAPQFPGPRTGGPGAERLRSAGLPVDESGLDLCLGCRTCEVVCPSGLHPAALVHQSKIRQVAAHGLSLRDWLLTHTDLLGQVAGCMPGLTNAALSARSVRWLMDQALRIDRRRPMPRYASFRFRSWFARRASPWRTQPAPNGQVLYFHGCATESMLPEIGRQTVEVLERNGFEVLLPEQCCCGLPLIGNGDLEAGRRLARYNLQRLRPYAEKGLPILFTSTSCSLTFKQAYARELGLAEAGAVAEQCSDIFEFLVRRLEQGLLCTDFRPVEGTLPYHQPCHQRAQSIGTPAVTLLRLVPGLRIWNLDAGCCGASGTHGFKREKYDLSMAVGAPLAAAIGEANADAVLSDCETCRWQIEHTTDRPAFHPITVLWQAYGLGGSGRD